MKAIISEGKHVECSGGRRTTQWGKTSEEAIFNCLGEGIAKEVRTLHFIKLKERG